MMIRDLRVLKELGGLFQTGQILGNYVTFIEGLYQTQQVQSKYSHIPDGYLRLTP
jgi:hypothetical protein